VVGLSEKINRCKGPYFHQQQTFVGKERPLRANTGCEQLQQGSPYAVANPSIRRAT